jgi:hypothetical protein
MMEKDNVLSIVSYNAHSLCESELLYLSSMFDIIGVTEAWDVFEDHLQEEKLQQVRKQGIKGMGFAHSTKRRGVVLFFGSHVNIRFSAELSCQENDLIMVVAFVASVVVCLVYLPDGSTRGPIDKLCDRLSLICSLHRDVVVIGDLNARWEFPHRLGNCSAKNAAGIALMDWLVHQPMQRIPINVPTFKDVSTLDHCLTTMKVEDFGTVEDLISDHKAIYVSILVEHLNKDIFKRRKKVCIQKAVAVIEQMVAQFEEYGDIDAQVNSFTKIVNDAVEVSTHWVRVRKQSSGIWVDDEVRKLVRKRSRLISSGRKHSLERRTLDRQIRRLIRQARRKAWKKSVFDGLKDGKGSWRFFKRSRGENRIELATDEAKVSSDFQKFHLIDRHVHLHVKKQTSALRINLQGAVLHGITFTELERARKALVAKPSRGPDGIPQHILKFLGMKTLTFLLHVFNACLRLGESPKVWRLAAVRAIAKPQGGFRPISLLCCLGKLMERIIEKRIRDQCAMHIPTYQYALTGGTEAALEGLLDHVVSSSNQKRPCFAAFLDAVKAFDRVYVPKLMSILHEYALDPFVLRWLSGYLGERYAYVGKREFAYKLSNGVPQGSVLSPLLFMLYISGVFRGLDVLYCAQYADDLVLLTSHEDASVAVRQMNDALRVVAKRCKDLAVTLDGCKCKCMWLQRGRKIPPCPNIILEGRVLEYVPEYNYLGVIIDNKLTFESMIRKKIAESARRGAYVWRLTGSAKRKRRTLWLGYVCSYLVYGVCTFYHLLSKARKNKLHSFYFGAARNICGLIGSTYGPLAVHEAGLEPLESVIDRRRRKLLARMSGAVIPKIRATKSPNIVELCGSMAWQQELVFGRWRTNAMYSNILKHKMGSRDDDLCRYCGLASETREHVLFSCGSIAACVRHEYLTTVCALLNCGYHDISLKAVLAQEGPLSKKCVQGLAVALWCYMEKIDYKA